MTPRPSRRSEKGQASIMMGIMVLTFLFLFCFVVNIGMLVNAKINLQNAADLAAYAGAAVEARQLNKISYLNYEMRRQYKKFLFRYYVIGNMAQKQFPSAPSGQSPSTKYDWSPDGILKLNVPAVCLIFNSNDNYCQVPRLQAIRIPPATGYDAINDALIANLQKLEKIRQDNCSKIGYTNLITLEYWLLNGDPDASKMSQLASAGVTQSTADAAKLVSGLVKGLGLVPRELILQSRINTLKGYLNYPPQKGVTLDTASSLRGLGDPHKAERTIQAFYSAFYTLGNWTFPSDSIEMDEIEAPQQLDLKFNRINFDTYALWFETDPTTHNCNPSLLPQPIQNVPIGTSKNSSVLTYYAVRLKAKAKLLFNPWGPDGLELKAYAAAQPFGSRIGPTLTESSFVRNNAQASNLSKAVGTATDLFNQVPNLPITNGDSLQNGWNTREVLGTLLSAAFPKPKTAQKGGFVVTEQNLGYAYQVAMAPNPYELGRYNIINDLGSSIQPHHFVPDIFDQNRAYIFWAPVAPPDDPGGVAGKLKGEIQQIFVNTGAMADAAQLKQTLQNQLVQYLNSIKGNNLDQCAQTKITAGLDDQECESFNLVRLANPLRPRPAAVNLGFADNKALLPLPEWIMPQQATELDTSWDSPNDPPLADDPGRFEYSVKFVAFKSLFQGSGGNGDDQPVPLDSGTKSVRLTNPPGQGDDEASIDLNYLEH